MKKLTGRMVMIVLLANTFLMSAYKADAQPGVNVSFNEFYDNLSPYGQWIDDPSYGYVWVPSVGSGFRPYYSGGHWVMTEYGNMWVSDYPWGWAPFHYGRWTYDSFHGWVWIPGTEWGPAWVVWRSSPNYYGWAPLGPGISLTMSYGSYYPPYDWWAFVPPTYIHHNQWHNYCYGPRRNTTIIQNTTIINNTYNDNSHTYITGPRADEIRKVTNRNVPVYRVQRENKPGREIIQNNSVKVYRPSIQRSGKDVAPSRFKKAENPIGKPQPLDRGNRVQLNGRQNENANKDQLRNNAERKADDRRSAEPTRREQQPLREKAERKPVESSRPADRKEIRSQRENIPQQGVDRERMDQQRQEQKRQELRNRMERNESQIQRQPQREVAPAPQRQERQERQYQAPAPQRQEQRQERQMQAPPPRQEQRQERQMQAPPPRQEQRQERQMQAPPPRQEQRQERQMQSPPGQQQPQRNHPHR